METQPTIGVITPLRNIFRGRRDFFSRVIAGAQTAITSRGGRLLLIEAMQKPTTGASLAVARVDGWLTTYLDSTVDALRDSGRPMVSVACQIPRVPAVLPDNHTGVRALMRHLLEHGHSRIAMVGDWQNSDVRQRRDAYLQAILDAGLELDPALVIEPEVEAQDRNTILTIRGGQLAGRKLMDMGLPCTAVFAGTDLMAIGLLEAVRKAGIRVPQDLVVVGFDDEEASQHTQPPLTTVHQGFEAIGEMAIELLCEQIARGTILPLETYVPTHLVVRRSCGCDQGGKQADRLEAEESSQPEPFAQRLVEPLFQSANVLQETSVKQLSHAVSVLVNGVEAVRQDLPLPTSDDIAQAWNEIVAVNADIEPLCELLSSLELAGAQLAGAPTSRASDRARLGELLWRMRVELIRAYRLPEKVETDWLNTLLLLTQGISERLFGGDSHQVSSLAWLAETPARRACLGLWSEDFSKLVVVGVYGDETSQEVRIGQQFEPEVFPPEAVLTSPKHDQAPGWDILFRLQTSLRAWGVLCVHLPEQFPALSFALWASFLATGLERVSLIKMISRLALPVAPTLPIDITAWHGSASLADPQTPSAMVEIRFVERGQIDYWVGERLCPMSAGQLGVVWNVLPSQILSVTPGAVYYRFCFPFHWFLQRDLPETIVQPILHGNLVLDSAVSEMETFHRWHADLQGNRNETQKAVLLEVEARLLRMAYAKAQPPSSSSNSPAHAIGSISTRRAEQMAHFIAEHYLESLRKEDIAGAAGLNPSYAIRLFHSHFGLSPVEFVNRYRIAHAQRLLATTDQAILDVALDAGFGSLSNFYIVFKRTCEMTPNEFREPFLRKK